MHDAFCDSLGPINHFILHHAHEAVIAIWVAWFAGILLCGWLAERWIGRLLRHVLEAESETP